MSRSVRPLLHIIPFFVVMVTAVRPLASQQLTEAAFISSVNSAIQPLLSETPGKPIIMAANLEFAHGGLITKFDISVLLAYIDGLKAAGVQRIELNPGYLSLQDPVATGMYDQLVHHIRQLGLLLAINPEYLPKQQPITTFQQFQDGVNGQPGAVTGVQQLAARYQPDNFVIVHEPDTWSFYMGFNTTVQQWDGFIRAAAPLIRQSSPHTRLGAGCAYGSVTQAFNDSENANFEDFVTIPDLDFLTLDVYADTFSQFATWTQLAHAAGKGAYIEETWIPHYFANGLPADITGPLSDLATVGPDSADFASLFGPWLQAMALFASANGMEAVSAFTTPAFFQYGTSTSADVAGQTAYDNIVASAISNGQLTPTGQAYLASSQQLGIKMAASTSSASYATLPSVFCSSATNPNPCNGYADSSVSPDELMSAFGVELATSKASASSSDFPTTLGGTTATLVDSANHSYPVQLDFVSPGQVNYLVPAAAQAGSATLTITSADGTKNTSVVLISPADPGIYTANANGQGAAAGFAVCAGTCEGWPNRQANGQSVQELFSCAGGTCAPQPIHFSGADDNVVLELFGTGLRHVAATAVTATVNGVFVPVQFVGAQDQFTGEDQINVQIPSNLAAIGLANLVLTTKVTQSQLALYDTQLASSSNSIAIDIE